MDLLEIDLLPDELSPMFGNAMVFNPTMSRIWATIFNAFAAKETVENLLDEIIQS